MKKVITENVDGLQINGKIYISLDDVNKSIQYEVNKIKFKLNEEIMDWCYKNNTIETQYPHLRLAILDGGWVNVIQLKKFLEGENEEVYNRDFCGDGKDLLEKSKVSGGKDD